MMFVVTLLTKVQLNK